MRNPKTFRYFSTVDHSDPLNVCRRSQARALETPPLEATKKVENRSAVIIWPGGGSGIGEGRVRIRHSERVIVVTTKAMDTPSELCMLPRETGHRSFNGPHYGYQAQLSTLRCTRCRCQYLVLNSRVMMVGVETLTWNSLPQPKPALFLRAKSEYRVINVQHSTMVKLGLLTGIAGCITFSSTLRMRST